RTVREYETHEAFLAETRAAWTPWNEARQHMFEHIHPRTLPNGRLTFQVKPTILAQEIASLCDLRFDQIYTRLHCPALFLPAAKEPKLAEKIAIIAEHATNTSAFRKSVVIPDTEHLMALDHARELSAEILLFLREITK
ncbi:MAG: hypothetical protein ACXVDB_09760, partial [Tumebacillaceae bacterium]